MVELGFELGSDKSLCCQLLKDVVFQTGLLGLAVSGECFTLARSG